MKQHTHQSSESRRARSPVQNDLFTTISPTASSQVSGGHWSAYSTRYPAPPRHYSYGRRPSSSHQIAAQRLNQALFAYRTAWLTSFIVYFC